MTSPPDIAAAQADIDAFRADVSALRAQVSRVLVGQDEVVEGVIAALLCSGHVLLEGVPGVGKTLLVRTLARAMSLSFGRVQFTPDLMPADITGTSVVAETPRNGRVEREFVFRPGPIFAQLILADEINRATPKTQSALLEAMQERSVTAGGATHLLPSPFLVMATQNPLEQEGTYPLPEAQLDRFFFKLLVGYATRAQMAEILGRTTAGHEPSVDPVINAERIVSHQRLVRRVAIAPHVQDYAIRLVLATHPPGALSKGEFATPMVAKLVRVGASPRAAQAIVLAAKWRAISEGRPSASHDDVRWAARPALRHRIIMNFEGESEGVTQDAVIENILQTLPTDAV